MKAQRMKKKTFFTKLKQIIQSKSFEELPPLLTTALQSNLPILIVMDTWDDAQTLVDEDTKKRYARCLVSMDEFSSLDFGTAVDEIEFKLTCRDLISQGYDGICFLVDGAMLGLEWDDFIPDKSKL